MVAGLWVWTASRAFLKVLVKIIVFMINFCCLCSCEWLMDRRNDKKKGKNRQKKMYTQDLLNIIGNPRYNPISDPAYDIEKYSKLCAGIMFLCEGEVLMLQRNSNNNDRTFDFPGGTIDNEDFNEYYNNLMTHREYKKKLKNAHRNMKYGVQGAATAVADTLIDSVDHVTTKVQGFTNPEQPENEIIVVDGAANAQNLTQPAPAGDGQSYQSQAAITGPIDHNKRPIYPQVPLYDSFYYADIFSSQFQTLGLNSWQQQGHMKRKQLETLYEQATRHYKHGFGFDSSPWTAAVRETQEELNYFPKTISPIAVFNLYRGWTDIDSDSDNSSDESDSGDSDLEIGVDPESQKLITGRGLKQQNGKNLNINASLLGNGKLIGDNFRRYTLYVCSITPEERNHMSANLKLSEEHSEFAWMPLTLLIPMHSTHVSVFKHFRLHPWVIAFIEQYSSQFDKLSRKTFWVGYNRHFAERVPQITDETGAADNDDVGGKEKKKGKGKKKGKKGKDAKNGLDDDVTAQDEVSENVIDILKTGDVDGDNKDGVVESIDTNNTTATTTTISEQEDEDDDVEGGDVGADGKKKKKGKKGKKEGKKKNQKDTTTTITTSTSSTTDSVVIDIDQGLNGASEGSADDSESAEEGFTQAYYDETAIPVEPCDRDVFITVFLPLVRKYINPKVYL